MTRVLFAWMDWRLVETDLWRCSKDPRAVGIVTSASVV
jgi:hypothetical protein